MIIICKICGQFVCPPACPEFDGYVTGLGNATSECEICGVRNYEGDGHFMKNGKAICSECTEELISPELLEFLDLADIKEFFDMLL